MSTCEHISKKSGQGCGKPCPDTLRKKRCEKHGGEDLINFVTIVEAIDDNINPYKPASKEWLEWNKKQKKKSKKDKPEILEVNPFIEPSETTKLAIKCLKDYTPSADYSFICINNNKYLLKGTPIYYNDNTKYYIASNSFKIDLLSVRNHKGWGTTELEVVKDESDIDISGNKASKSQKLPINQFIIESQHLCDKEINTFRKYMKEIGNKNYLFYISDIPTKTDEKEQLLELAGNYEHIKYSDNFHRLDVDPSQKWSIIIKMDHLSDEDLQKLFDKKISMRETCGDDTMYREFLYKRYGVKRIGGPEYHIEEDKFGEKFLNEY
jgi:hypothetical protein